MATHAKFIKLFLAHQDDLRAFLASLVRNHEDREDVLQDTVVTLWEKFDKFDPSRSFGAWARGIAANKVLQHRGRSGRVPTLFSPQVIVAILDAFQRREPLNSSESLDALDECMKPLSVEFRRILVLRYVEQLPVWKIAEVIGSTPTATSKTLSRLRTKLLDCVKRRLSPVQQEKAL